MTESMTTEATSQPVELPEIPAAYQPMVDLNKQMLADWANNANDLVRAVNAQQNVETTIQDTIDNSEDETLVKYRAYIEEQEAQMQAAYNQIRDYVKAELLPADTDAIDPTEALAQWKELKDSYEGLKKVMVKFPGFDEKLVDAITADVPTIESMGRHRGSGKGESGIRRPRVARIRYRVQGTTDWTESFVEKTVKGVTTREIGFTPLGANLRKEFGKVDNGQLRMEADEAAGTTEWVSLKGKPFTFYVAIPRKGDEENNVIVEIEVTPKEGKAEAEKSEKSES